MSPDEVSHNPNYHFKRKIQHSARTKDTAQNTSKHTFQLKNVIFLDRGLGFSQTPPSVTRLPHLTSFSRQAFEIRPIYLRISSRFTSMRTESYSLFTFIFSLHADIARFTNSFHFIYLISNKGPYGLLWIAYNNIHRYTDNIQLYIIRPRRSR